MAQKKCGFFTPTSMMPNKSPLNWCADIVKQIYSPRYRPQTAMNLLPLLAAPGTALNLALWAVKSGCILHFIFHHCPLSPGWYGNRELIHSAYVLRVAVHECRCVSRGSGGSSMKHMPGKFCHHLYEERRRVGQERRERPMEGYKGKGCY